MGGRVEVESHPAFAPVVVLGLLLAAASALVFALLAGRRLAALFGLVPAAGIGILLGQLAAEALGSTRLLVGDLHLPEALAGALVLLLIAARLGL